MMEISHEHKLIWLSPEMSGTDNVSGILRKYGFSELKGENNIESTFEYPDYKVICGMRNPYDRFFYLFYKVDFASILVKKDQYDVFKSKFNDWGRKTLIPQKLKVSVDETFIDTSNTPKYLKNWVFDNKIPDFFVRAESFDSDLKLLGFSDNEIDNKGYNSSFFTFNKMYDFDVAKRVYHLYKKHFYLCDYDPFSFTTEELTHEEKVKFIHDIV
jgi:hypothetical protein